MLQGLTRWGIIQRMLPAPSVLTPSVPAAPARRPARWRRWLNSWQLMLDLGAALLVLALSPNTYTAAFRAAAAAQLVHTTWQSLPRFISLAALLSLVLIRIVVVTALSYGLSQYALQMVIRVLVLELIPLSAAMFVALRTGLGVAPTDTPIAQAPVHRLIDLNPTRLHLELTPRALADAFAVLALALLSSVVALVLAYGSVYGSSPWGLDDFTRTVGQVFDLTVSGVFVIKSLAFSLAVAVVPLAATLEHPGQANGPLQPGAVRLFVVLLMLEAASLAVKYV
ncbi:MAG: hypothetical protein Fur007_04820 [Rhodoferax sp.]